MLVARGRGLGIGANTVAAPRRAHAHSALDPGRIGETASGSVRGDWSAVQSGSRMPVTPSPHSPLHPAEPDTIVFTQALPKNRSVKIVGRLLRDADQNRSLGATIRLADPTEDIRTCALTEASDGS
jgi:hypothetical protein